MGSEMRITVIPVDIESAKLHGKHGLRSEKKNATNLSHQRSIVQETMVEFCIKSNKSGDTLDLLHVYWANIGDQSTTNHPPFGDNYDLALSYAPNYLLDLKITSIALPR
ncbi:uncharacterized protein LAJ45_03842 [Morchella importuna]|uniref:uncharacterized protein n=1 Tax=Morchella importuna TaxID=1174673 RepID=UPI001E8CF589|nr:uncharacterized protein LAJ45_03842 [Morchella importuna]KAH8151849.1 hypothetical protein LAJ45_03842 [Morchella importuna]